MNLSAASVITLVLSAVGEPARRELARATGAPFCKDHGASAS